MNMHDQAYVLTASPYQEASSLVRLLTRNHGILSAVVRGVRHATARSTGLRAALQQGSLVECQWGGKSSLKTVYQLDLLNGAGLVSAEQLVCLGYVHELLLYFLREDSPAEGVFPVYGDLLAGMSSTSLEKSLRRFEFSLLDVLGYGMDLSWDNGGETPVIPGAFYQVMPGAGVRRCSPDIANAMPGSSLLAIGQGDYEEKAVLRDAKLLARRLLSFHMEGKQIRSRHLYQALIQGQ